MTRLRYAVVPTRDRPEDYADCLAAIAPQVDAVIPVFHVTEETGEYITKILRSYTIKEGAEELYYGGFMRVQDSDRAVFPEPYKAGVGVYCIDPPNISQMWNLGLGMAHEHAAGEPYDVAVLNDDVIVPPDWFERVSTEMQLTPNLRASAGCVHRPADHRMTGYAFILNGDDGLRADEQFQWWWGDSDLEMQARRLRGVVFAGGEDVEHRRPNSTTVGRLAEIAAEDGLRYREKWRT